MQRQQLLCTLSPKEQQELISMDLRHQMQRIAHTQNAQAHTWPPGQQAQQSIMMMTPQHLEGILQQERMAQASQLQAIRQGPPRHEQPQMSMEQVVQQLGQQVEQRIAHQVGQQLEQHMTQVGQHVTAQLIGVLERQAMQQPQQQFAPPPSHGSAGRSTGFSDQGYDTDMTERVQHLNPRSTQQQQRGGRSQRSQSSQGDQHLSPVKLPFKSRRHGKADGTRVGRVQRPSGGGAGDRESGGSQYSLQDREASIEMMDREKREQVHQSAQQQQQQRIGLVPPPIGTQPQGPRQCKVCGGVHEGMRCTCCSTSPPGQGSDTPQSAFLNQRRGFGLPMANQSGG